MSIRIAVVMGGPSAEHEVSLNSGREVMIYLDKAKYAVRAVVITHEKAFYYYDVKDGAIPEIADLGAPGKSKGFKGPFRAQESAPVWKDCSAAFLALHGTFGEDGVIQGFLDTIGIPYTGSGVYASAVAMDKIASKFLYIQNGLTVPPWLIFGIDHPEVTIESIVSEFGFPCFCKCPQSGSSRLMGKAVDEQSLRRLLDELQKSAKDILVEKAIDGIEFSCGVLEFPDGAVKALPVVEIRPVSSDFFDYEAKYTEGGSQEIVPAPHPKELLDRVEKIALAAHQILGCRGFSRTDIISKGDALYVLETNTLPGLTSNSLLPKEFKATRGTYSGLLDIMIETALKKEKCRRLMSWILGIDTSSVDLGVGIFHDNQPVASSSRYVRYSHAEHIDKAVLFLIETAGIRPEEIDRIAVTTGPGSFTGLRIGLAFVKGFCADRRVPALPLSSLLVMAQSQRTRYGRVITAIDARNDEVYWGTFSIENGIVEKKKPDSLSSIDEFRNFITPDDIIITDMQGYARSTVFAFLEKRNLVFPVERFPIHRGFLCAEIGSGMLDATEAWRSPEELLPDYLRPSAAQIKAGS